MSEDLRPENSVGIEVPVEKVWEALTAAEMRKQWFFGVDTETDWKAGSPIVHSGEDQGKTYEDRGIILEIELPRLLVHSHWSPVSGLPDRPENHEWVSWELSESDGGTELTIRESNLLSEEGRATSEKNWRMVLEDLKRLLEGTDLLEG